MNFLAIQLALALVQFTSIFSTYLYFTRGLFVPPYVYMIGFMAAFALMAMCLYRMWTFNPKEWLKR